MNNVSRLTSLMATAALLISCGGASHQDSAAPRTALLATSGSSGSASATALVSMASSSAAADYTPLLQQLYVAYFARPADPAGLAWFSARFGAAAAPATVAALIPAYARDPAVRALVDTFANSAEAKALYGGDNAAFVAALYHNLFSREPEAAGLAYWRAQLDSGAVSHASAALTLLASARGSDVDMAASKASMASTFTRALDTPARVRAYDGAAPNATAGALLAQARPGNSAQAELVIATQVIDTLVALVDAPPAPSTTADGAATLSAITTLVGDASCSAASECQTLALGAKACGGPEAYLPWSSSQTSGTALGELAYRYRAQRLAAQAAGGISSDCRFVPDPGATCQARAGAPATAARSCVLAGDSGV